MRRVRKNPDRVVVTLDRNQWILETHYAEKLAALHRSSRRHDIVILGYVLLLVVILSSLMVVIFGPDSWASIAVWVTPVSGLSLFSDRPIRWAEKPMRDVGL